VARKANTRSATPVYNAADDYVIADRGSESANLALGDGGGAVDDFLARVTVTTTPATSALNIYDGDPAGSGVLLLAIPASTAVGTSYELGVRSKVGGFYMQDDANNGAVIAVGDFT